MRSRIKLAILAVTAAAVIPWGTGQAIAAPEQGNVLGKKSEWKSPGDEARDLLEQTIGDDLPQFPYCRRPLERLDLMINSSDFVWPNSLTILGETQTVDINNLDLIGGPFVDPSRQLWWSSGMWLAWRAAVFAENGQPELAEQAARALLEAIASNPDPGVPTPESREAATAVKWNFGNTYRRSQALLCLRAVLPAAELEPLIRMHANTFLEPLRYPGPPRIKPHNLGMLVNLHLLDVADAIADPNYAAAAVGRLSSEFPQVFSRAGFSYEGSSHYHGVNYLGWTEAMFALQNRGYAAEAGALAEILKRALDAAAHFISPTGEPMLFGNTRASDALIRPEVDKNRPLRVIDSEAGMAFGRSSWTKKSSTVWSAVNRPKRGSHGHYDALAVTWQTDGIPILVDAGQPRYDRSPLNEWSRSTSAHNTVNVVGQNTTRYVRGSLKHRKDSRIDVVNMHYANRSFNCQREAMWDDRRKLFSAHDSCNRRAIQNWMFHPDWKVDRVKKNQARLSHPSGKKLYVTATKGANISACGGSESPICGWYATDFDVVVPAPQIVIAGGKAIDTQFSFGAPPIPAAAKMIGRPKEMNRKVSMGWKPIQVKATKKAAKKSKKNKKVAKLGNPVGYQTQIQRKNGNWTTVDISGSLRKLSTAANKLENGVPVRTRVRVWYKNGLSLPSKPTGWVTPHTTPGRVGIVDAKLQGKGKKRKVQVKCSTPENNGGAKVTSFEFKVGKGDWQRTKRCGAKFVMPGKKAVISWRAFNRAGAGKIVTWKLTVDSEGQLYVNGDPFPPPEPPASPETAAPAP